MRTNLYTTSVVCALLCLTAGTEGVFAEHSPLRKTSPGQSVVIPAGAYVPLYAQNNKPVRVHSFRLDRLAVTRSEYATFTAAHPEWRRDSVKVAGYLSDWSTSNRYGDADDASRPVTRITREAGAAYCSAQGKRLPTVDEWEYAANASPTMRDGSKDPAFRQMLVSLYSHSRSSKPDKVGTQFRNAFGVGDMHGLVWEWVAPESHEDMTMKASAGTAKHDLSCAGSANGASDARNFAAFLRYAFRSGLSSSSTAQNLGFRCAGHI